MNVGTLNVLPVASDGRGNYTGGNEVAKVKCYFRDSKQTVTYLEKIFFFTDFYTIAKNKYFGRILVLLRRRRL